MLSGKELQKKIDGLPNYQHNEKEFGSHTWSSSRIILHDNVTLDHPIIIRKNKSVIISSDTGINSSVQIINESKFDSCFIIEEGHRVAELEGLFLCYGGILIKGGVNKHWGIRRSTIAKANKGVEFEGGSTVGGLIEDVYFVRNQVNIECLQKQVNLINVNRCFFLETQTDNCGIVLATSHFSFRDCSWERSKNLSKAHFHFISGVGANTAGMTIIDNCRFGPEVSMPGYIAVIGGTPYGELTPNVVRGIHFHGDFRGAQFGMFDQLSPMVGCRVTNNAPQLWTELTNEKYLTQGGKIHEKNHSNVVSEDLASKLSITNSSPPVGWNSEFGNI